MKQINLEEITARIYEKKLGLNGPYKDSVLKGYFGDIVREAQMEAVRQALELAAQNNKKILAEKRPYEPYLQSRTREEIIGTIKQVV